MTVALFVYGTLMTGGVREGLLKGLRREPATTKGRLYDLPAGYPALALTGDQSVSGELVYDVDAARLGVLDRYEGVDEGQYKRVVVPVVAGTATITAETYVMDDPEGRGGRLIVDGRWRAVRRR